MRSKIFIRLFITSITSVIFVFSASITFAESNTLRGLEKTTFDAASKCRDEIVIRFELLLKNGQLTVGQLFDTFYIPIPNTYPQKFHTQYDKLFDSNIMNLLDSNLKNNSHFIYFIITDVNGYAPTHNSRYSQPLTGNKEVDIRRNRTKIIFNDRTGLAAARNTSPFLLQKYPRDTGEMIYDLSLPIMVRGQHWGCVRVGFSR